LGSVNNENLVMGLCASDLDYLESHVMVSSNAAICHGQAVVSGSAAGVDNPASDGHVSD